MSELQIPCKVAYVVKGFPRLSESFIANEVRWLTRMGMTLSVFSIKSGDALAERDGLPSIDYLPRVTSMSATTLWRWLRTNFGLFAKTQIWHLRHPIRYISTLGFALRNARKYRAAGMLKKTFIKEFLFATEISRRLAQQQGVRHIHAHFCHDATTIAWMVSQLTGLPFSFTAHAKDIYQEKLNPGDLLQRKLAATSFVTTCTHTNVAHLAKSSNRPHTIHGIYHGLDMSRFAPAETTPVSVDSTLRILSVGRHVEKKGFIYLIEACRLLREKGCQFELQIIGEPGDQTDLMQDLVERYDLSGQVRLLAPLVQEELALVYQRAHLFVLPCIVLADGDRDGIPNVMAEAMACALPVVVSAVSGIPELVEHERNGLLVADRNSVELADAIARLLNDSALRSRLGSNARDTIESCFDAAQTHKDLLKVFQNALEANRDAA